mmetsp:Transcript_21665/g.45253  ORF Transcript_21665/g.45253 Transcript_21665/m.45253 type:complete len:344 (+) Transcript_21665:237-1268(+)
MLHGHLQSHLHGSIIVVHIHAFRGRSGSHRWRGFFFLGFRSGWLVFIHGHGQCLLEKSLFFGKTHISSCSFRHGSISGRSRSSFSTRLTTSLSAFTRTGSNTFLTRTLFFHTHTQGHGQFWIHVRVDTTIVRKVVGSTRHGCRCCLCRKGSTRTHDRTAGQDIRRQHSRWNGNQMASSFTLIASAVCRIHQLTQFGFVCFQFSHGYHINGNIVFLELTTRFLQRLDFTRHGRSYKDHNSLSTILFRSMFEGQTGHLHRGGQIGIGRLRLGGSAHGNGSTVQGGQNLANFASRTHQHLRSSGNTDCRLRVGLRLGPHQQIGRILLGFQSGGNIIAIPHKLGAVQ